MLEVHVKDKGKGIRGEDMKKIFTEFGQGEDDQDLNKDGLGLGLSICQKIV